VWHVLGKLRDGELLIARSIWNGITTDPKSRKSKAPIPIIPKLAAKLEAHRARLRKPKTGSIFSKRAGNEIGPDSLLRRVILPALDPPIDFADGNTDGGLCHNPFPKPSRRSRATAAA